MPSVITVPTAAQPSEHFNVDAATDAYMAEIPADAKARSDAYFEVGYWLVLWDFLYFAAILLLLLNLRWSAAMRNWAERVTRFKPLQTFLYWVEYLLVVTILGFPLAFYEGYVREHKYGLATQSFGPWMGDQLKGLLVGLILGGLITVVLFAVVRRLPRTWWIWGSVVTMLFVIFTVMIAPVYIVPIFNKVTRLNDPKITEPILSMARANGIPAHDVFQIDASRQTTRMSANVSGFGKTMRITMNDNLLRRGSPEEIKAVMGHEMGHYVLHHIYKDMLFIFVVAVAGFALLRWALSWSLSCWGEKWQIRGIGDPAVLPLVVLLGSIYVFLLTPILNTQTRTEEAEADIFGLNASRQPDGFAQAAIHLGEYRKMKAGPLEEFVFYDHPSGYDRIRAAMQWKAENLKPIQAPSAEDSAPPGHTAVTTRDSSPARAGVKSPHSGRASRRGNLLTGGFGAGWEAIMFCRWMAVVGLSLSLSLAALAQVGGASAGNLRVRVVFSNDRAAPKHLLVQLMNGSSSIPVETGYTDDSGMVIFNRVSVGMYRLVVTGDQIQKADGGQFEVDPRKMTQTQYVTVERIADAKENSAIGSGMVNAAHFNIPENARKEFDKAGEAMAHEQWDKARSSLNKAIEIYPEYALAYNNLGVVYSRINDPVRESEALNKAISLDEHLASAYVNLAELCIRQKDYNRAESLLQKAIPLDPTHAKNYMLLADAQLLNQQYDAAIASAQKAHGLPHEKLALTHYIAAKAYEHQNRPKEAISELQEFLKEEPQGARADHMRQELQQLQRQAQ